MLLISVAKSGNENKIVLAKKSISEASYFILCLSILDTLCFSRTAVIAFRRPLQIITSENGPAALLTLRLTCRVDIIHCPFLTIIDCYGETNLRQFL